MMSDAKVDYVYILGASHSGTTLLAMLLNAHREVVSIGESAPLTLGNPDDYRCSCKSLIRRCPFWQRVSLEVSHCNPEFAPGNFGTAFTMPSHPLIQRLLRVEHRGPALESIRDLLLAASPAWRRRQAEVIRNCQALVKAVLGVSGARVFVDSSKLAHRLKFLLRVPTFDVKVIHMVRDGRAVALTYMDQDTFADALAPSLRRGGRGLDTRSQAARPSRRDMPMTRAADEWRRCIRAAQHVLARMDRAQWMQVRYEELCQDPAKTVGGVFRFLGLQPGLAVPEFRAVEHHVIGNGMRLDSTSQISLDERWKTSLTARDMKAFDAVAGKINRLYGYM